MVTPFPIPQRGDIVWVDFTPHVGHEQAGRRPALILSPETYNRQTGLAIACPITSQAKGYPFEVRLPTDLPITGVILSDHVRNIDWRARRAERAARVDEDTIADVCAKLSTLIGAD